MNLPFQILDQFLEIHETILIHIKNGKDLGGFECSNIDFLFLDYILELLEINSAIPISIIKIKQFLKLQEPSRPFGSKSPAYSQ